MVICQSSTNDPFYIPPERRIVQWPARLSGIISVGATDKNGDLQTYSARGTNLNIVAPSGRLQLQGDVVTTDRSDGAGYAINSGLDQESTNANYTIKFGGTSAACPQVSGVASLILSLYPELTRQEVTNIVLSNTKRVGTSGYPELSAVRCLFPQIAATAQGKRIRPGDNLGVLNVSLPWLPPGLQTMFFDVEVEYYILDYDNEYKSIFYNFTVSSAATQNTSIDLSSIQCSDRTVHIQVRIRAHDNGFYASIGRARKKIESYNSTFTSFFRGFISPAQLIFQQNAPNPLTDVTTFSYSLPESSSISLEVFNMSNQKVATIIDNQSQNADDYQVVFNASSLTSGSYTARLLVNNGTTTQIRTITMSVIR